MKPFDLEKALAGAPVMLRNGLIAYISGRRPPHIGGDMTAELVGWCIDGYVRSWTVCGKLCCDIERGLDIIGMAPIKQKRWMYVNPDGRASTHYESEEALMQAFGKPEWQWQIIEIEIEV